MDVQEEQLSRFLFELYLPPKIPDEKRSLDNQKLATLPMLYTILY
jgi:hypothetical protein